MVDWTAQDEAELQALEAEFSAKPSISDSLLDAVKWQESRGNVNAVSPAGAQGAYQFMPATAQEVRQQLGMSGPYDPSNAQEQRQMAAHYLGKQLDQFGSPELALAAYNAGPGNVQKALARAGEGAGWEQIAPYLPRETQKYVPSVLKKKDSTTGRPSIREQQWTPEMEAELQALESELGSGSSSETSGSEAPASGESKRSKRKDFMGAYSDNILGIGANLFDIPTGGFLDNIIGLFGGEEAAKETRRLKDDFTEENPVIGTTYNLAGAFLNPRQGAKTLGGSLARTALGAGTYAAGSADEGDWTDRASAFGKGATTGLAAELAMRGAGKGLKAMRGPAKSMAQGAKKSALGITKTDARKLAKNKRAKWDYLKGGSRPIDEALDVAEQQGVVSSKLMQNSPEQVYFRNAEKIDDLGKQISSLVSKADDVGGKMAKPKFKATESLIKDAKQVFGKGDESQKLYQKLQKDFDNFFDGSLRSLQEIKEGLNSEAYKSLTTDNASKRVMKAFTRDIKEAIEDRIDDLVLAKKLPKDVAGKIKKLNDTQGKLRSLDEIFTREAFGEGADDLVKAIKPVLRTSGGFGVPSMMIGGLPGALIGFGGGAALGSAPGRMLQSKALDKALVPALGGAGRALDRNQESLIKALIAAGQ